MTADTAPANELHDRIEDAVEEQQISGHIAEQLHWMVDEGGREEVVQFLEENVD